MSRSKNSRRGIKHNTRGREYWARRPCGGFDPCPMSQWGKDAKQDCHRQERRVWLPREIEEHVESWY